MLKYITSNVEKINTARRNLSPFGIEFEQQNLSIIEIQSDSLVDIATDKALKAFKKIHEPLFVSDHGWSIPALNGFPGPYMKYINQWFTSQDFLNLMSGHKDKRIIRHEVICYIDAKNVKQFKYDVNGMFVEKAKGQGYPAMRVVSFLPSGKTVAKCSNEGINSDDNNLIWLQFAKWYCKVLPM